MEGQLVDDDRGMTLVGVSTRASDLPQVDPEGRAVRVNRSFAAGKLLAQRALEIGVKRVVFDRGGYLYHGRVRGFADGAREGGLQF